MPASFLRPLVGYAAVLAAAGYFLWGGRHLSFGSVAQIGPGFFPTTLALLMAAMAALGIAVEIARRRGAEQSSGAAAQPVDWKSLALVSASILVFAASMRAAGLIPAVVLCFAVAALADPRTRLALAVALSLGLALLVWAIFIAGLGVSVPVFRTPW